MKDIERKEKLCQMAYPPSLFFPPQDTVPESFSTVEDEYDPEYWLMEVLFVENRIPICWCAKNEKRRRKRTSEYFL